MSKGRKSGYVPQNSYQGQRRQNEGQDCVTEMVFDLKQRKSDFIGRSYQRKDAPPDVIRPNPQEWINTGTRWIRVDELHTLSSEVRIITKGER